MARFPAENIKVRKELPELLVKIQILGPYSRLSRSEPKDEA